METSNKGKYDAEYEDEVTIPTTLLMGLIHIIPNLVLKVPKEKLGKSRKEADRVLAEGFKFLKSVQKDTK